MRIKITKYHIFVYGLYAFEIIMLLAMLAHPARAQMSDQCLDNTTLQRNMNFSFETDTAVKNLTITKNEDCRWGCDNVTNTCAPDPVTMNMLFGGGLMALIGIIALIVRRIKQM